MQADQQNSSSRKRHPEMVLAIISLVGLVWLAISVRNWMGQTREELGTRIVALESRVKGESEQFNQAVAKVEDANARLLILEQKLKESSAQQESLERLYKNMQRSRDETAIVEVEQLLNLASQQLRLLGNVESAILALQQAESRLGTQDRPSFVNVKRAINRDLSRLRSLPKLDLASLAQQLDEILRNIDKFQLLSDIRSVEPEEAQVATVTLAEPVAKEFNAMDWIVDALQTVIKGAWSDVTQLVRIREVGNPDAMMMSPSQAYFVRENFRLRLLNARLALLSRQQKLLREDLNAADLWLKRYFDLQDPRVAEAKKVLEGIRQVEVAFELPTLQDSLSTLKLNRTDSER
jgi:uncharacterized protein HemX